VPDARKKKAVLDRSLRNRSRAAIEFAAKNTATNMISHRLLLNLTFTLRRENRRISKTGDRNSGVIRG
jgi:hypothetical protein